MRERLWYAQEAFKLMTAQTKRETVCVCVCARARARERERERERESFRNSILRAIFAMLFPPFSSDHSILLQDTGLRDPPLPPSHPWKIRQDVSTRHFPSIECVLYLLCSLGKISQDASTPRKFSLYRMCSLGKSARTSAPRALVLRFHHR